MEAKSIALTIVFSSIAIALNLVKIPVIFYPGTFYQISQIPIVAAFLLFGARIGILIGVLNIAGGLVLFPLGPAGLIIYSMDFISLLLMFAGLYVASRFMKGDAESERLPIWQKPIFGFTAGAIAFRGGIMPFIDYGVVFHILLPLILGINRPESAIVGLMPVFILYNITVSIYTIPIAYLVAVKVGKYLKIELPL
jgi:hypothetical protein